MFRIGTMPPCHLQQACHVETTRPSTKALKRRTASAAAKAGVVTQIQWPYPKQFMIVYVMTSAKESVNSMPYQFCVYFPVDPSYPRHIFAKHPKTSARGRQLPLPGPMYSPFARRPWRLLNSGRLQVEFCVVSSGYDKHSQGIDGP